MISERQSKDFTRKPFRNSLILKGKLLKLKLISKSINFESKFEDFKQESVETSKGIVIFQKESLMISKSKSKSKRASAQISDPR